MEVDAQSLVSNSSLITVNSSPYSNMKFFIKDLLGIFAQIHCFLEFVHIH